MRPATEIIHGSTGGNRDADPLTTPIYETTTFVFENAAEVKAFNEGKSKKFLYSRYGNPTIGGRRADDREDRRGRVRHAPRERHGGDVHGAPGLLTSGDEVVCSAAIYGGTLHLLADLFPRYGIQGDASSRSTSCGSPSA